MALTVARGYTKIHSMQVKHAVCIAHCVAKIMRNNRIKAQTGCKRRYIKGGKTAEVAASLLNRNFNPEAPNLSWVSDITYVRTYEGFLYVATVLGLFSRRIVGWSMGKNIDRHLVIEALLMAKLRRQPKHDVLLHSDQGSQYGSQLLWKRIISFLP